MSSQDLRAVSVAQKHLLSLMRGSRLQRREVSELLRLLLGGQLGRRSEFTCGALLSLLMRDELLDVETLKGIDDAIATYARPTPRVRVPGQKVGTIVGSGKDEYKTFNVSTCAAVVAASCGACVVKVGCGAESSVAGTTDIFQALRFAAARPSDDSIRALGCMGFALFEIEAVLPELFALYIGRSPVFNVLEFVLPAYLGIEVDAVVYGIADERTELAGEVLRSHGRSGLIVTGVTNTGLRFDEISVLGPSKLSCITNHTAETFKIHPEDIGLSLYRDEDVAAADSLTSAVSLVRSILQGKGNLAQNAMVAANAGALLWMTGKTESLLEGVMQALEAVRSGRGWRFLEEIRGSQVSAGGIGRQ